MLVFTLNLNSNSHDNNNSFVFFILKLWPIAVSSYFDVWLLELSLPEAEMICSTLEAQVVAQILCFARGVPARVVLLGGAAKRAAL